MLAEAEPAVDRLKVLVLPIVADAVDPAIARTLDGIVSSGLAARAELRVVTIDDLNSLVEAELLKDSVGCDDLTCSSELAGSIAAERILAGHLGRLGDHYVLTLRWLDAVYAEPIAHASETAASEDALPRLAPRVLARLFNEALPQDARARQEKRAPSFWTVEGAVGTGGRSGPEPYSPLASASARVAWGGREYSTGLYFYGVFGVDVMHAQGAAQTVAGRLSYDRNQWAPFVELRGALPLAQRERTRLYVGLGGALAVDRHSARPAGAEPSSGTALFGALRFSAGLWHHWNRPLSFFGGYRLQALFVGGGADPISERYALGSSRADAYAHLVELGVGWHF